jgi:large subunit ribosomal protein L13
MKTRVVKKSEIQEKWYEIDATGMRLGNLATKAAEILLGKMDVLTRDYHDPKVKLVIVNIDKLDMTAKRMVTKKYTRYSGYPSGLKERTLEEAYVKYPEFVITHAIKGMLPKGTRGRNILNNNLFLSLEADHAHQAQKPEKLNVREVKI